MMETIRSLFLRDVGRTIEEVIKVDQHDEQTVLTELEEYVVTPSIRDQFRTVYDEIVQVRNNPREGIGVWISGFFGSGKSSFAKILGYTVSARPVQGVPASKIFKDTVKDAKISGFLDIINTTIPTEAVIFDVSMDRGVRTANERITEIMYKALLRKLDYAEDFDLAELEYALEGDGRLNDFVKRFEDIYGKPWRTRRKLGTAINEAGAVLHALDPMTYPQADSYAHSVGTGRADIDPKKLSARAFELADRRCKGKALIFVIDEVGRYVARSSDKMVDLQGVIQAFGVEGKNRVLQKKALAPFWIVVTSQEKLNEIVDALDSKKVDLATLQDRFRVTIDLKQSDIAEVTGERVLKKKEEKKALIESLYAGNEGRLRSFCTLERTHRNATISKDDFVRLYPYLPYQINLCIDIVSGLRLKRGSQRHIGGSNRTIIKQAQEILINPRTMLAEKPVGTLVTLDQVYELLYLGNLLPSETTREVDDVPNRLPGNEPASRVTKAIALLEVVKDLPRTVHNIAVALHPSVEADSIRREVEEAVKALEDAQVIRDSDDGYKLLTVQEKTWDTTRRGLEPKPLERNQIVRNTFRTIFADPKLRTYRYQELKSFKLALNVRGEAVETDGDIPLHILLADDQEEWNDLLKDARENSVSHQDKVYWACALSEEIHEALRELYRSQEMVRIHTHLAPGKKLSDEENACLSQEQTRQDRHQRTLRGLMLEALQSGAEFFRGVQKDASALGQKFSDALHKLLDDVIPALYPKLKMGVRSLIGNEAEKFLSAANLNGLPSVFYSGDDGLCLVVKEGDKFVPNSSAEICKEVQDYVVREHKYGTKVTGKMLESYFQGIGYGWDRDVVQLVLAVLLRAGAVELTHQGRKYKTHDDPEVRKPFTATNAFRSASFAPREPIGLKTLAAAARHYEEITGKEIDIEEGAISKAFKKLAASDREDLLPLLAEMKAQKLPGLDFVQAHLTTLEGIMESAADDCVKTLAGEGKSYKEARSRLSKLKEAVSEKNLRALQDARVVMQALWPPVKVRTKDESLMEKAAELCTLLESETFYDSIEAIRLAAQHIAEVFQDLYRQAHENRASLFQNVLETVKGLEEYAAIAENPSITDADRQALLAPLLQRACGKLDVPKGSAHCSGCGATPDQLESDAALVEAIRDNVVRKVQELAAPEDKETIERVRVSNLFVGKLETKEDVTEAVEKLKDYLLKLLAAGKKIVLE